jgi:hypothetical protein
MLRMRKQAMAMISASRMVTLVGAAGAPKRAGLVVGWNSPPAFPETSF